MNLEYMKVSLFEMLQNFFMIFKFFEMHLYVCMYVYIYIYIKTHTQSRYAHFIDVFSSLP